MLGGAVAEWSKALLVREKNENQKSQVRPPTWAPLKKNKDIYYVRILKEKRKMSSSR